MGRRSFEYAHGLDETLVARLERRRQQRNEVYQIAAPLAARLGLERLVSMDDHSSDAPFADEKSAGEAIMKAWDNAATAQRRETDDRLEKGLDTSQGVLAYYCSLNAPDQARLIYDSDFGAALAEPSTQRYGRIYVAGWETRNLRMASNIREAMAEHPGEKMLVIVGASHKWYLQAYLDMMHDVRLADSEALLQ